MLSISLGYYEQYARNIKKYQNYLKLLDTRKDNRWNSFVLYSVLKLIEICDLV